jgi:hypothetical protein
MNPDPDSGVSIYLVFGVILVGAIALFARIKEQRSRKSDRRDETDDPRA